jgi:transposase
VTVAQPVVDQHEQFACGGDLGDVAAAAGFDALFVGRDLGCCRVTLHRLDRRPPDRFGALFGDVKVKGWLNRRDDPEFWDRVVDVCGLYLNGQERAIVVNVDEKTGIQAKKRIAATTPAVPGRAARYEFEYRRHGTASLLAVMDVHSGEVLATDIARNDSVTFIAFLEEIDRNVDLGLVIHLVMDNGSSHTSKQTRAWLAAHPRFVVHYTPKHASWVNMVELFFSIVTRKVLKRGNFSSRDDLVSKLMRFITSYNETAKPFAWTYTGQPLKVAA